VISLDPGVRTFMSYDPSGVSVEWGKNDIGRIYRLNNATSFKVNANVFMEKKNKRKRYRQILLIKLIIYLFNIYL